MNKAELKSSRILHHALVSLIPPALSDSDPFPGSLLAYIATLASPGTFIWSRLIDAVSSITARQTLEINDRVERWALDEVPLPGKLVNQIVQWLYRENRFCRGTLRVSQMLVGPSNLSVPALAVVTMADEVAPLASVKPCIDAMPATGVRIIEYPGEVGVGLQHLGILVGRQARAHVWPEIIRLSFPECLSFRRTRRRAESQNGCCRVSRGSMKARSRSRHRAPRRLR